MESDKFKFVLLGTSYDLRTNKWKAICKKCSKSHEPQTTMLAKQTVTCKCGELEVVDYNNLKS
jgi:hypothetical protein